MKTKIRWMNFTVILLSVLVLSAMAWIIFTAFGGPGGAAAREDALSWCAQNATMSLSGQPVSSYGLTGVLRDETGKEHSFTEKDGASPSETQSETVRMENYGAALEFGVQPDTLAITITNAADGAAVFSGTAQEFSQNFRPQNGEYLLHADATYAKTLQTDQGTYEMRAQLSFEAPLTVDIKLDIYLSDETVSQGDVLLLCADGLQDPAAISAELPFDYTPVFEQTPSGCYAYIPFNYMRAEGEYEITVDCMGTQQVLKYTVTEPDYEVQHLTVSASTVSSTVGDNSAVTEYNRKMDELAAVTDSEIYWSEPFLQPVEGTITTEFGIKRFTNNADTPTRHAGIDIATAEGTPVAASNAGRVIFADYLQVSGYTVVIEHGMGLKTFYLHLSELDCAEGDVVSRGDTIGKVGMTGFSTGPHLHFQAQVGSMCISPWYLFDGSSGVYLMQDKMS